MSLSHTAQTCLVWTQSKHCPTVGDERFLSFIGRALRSLIYRHQLGGYWRPVRFAPRQDSRVADIERVPAREERDLIAESDSRLQALN